METQLLDVDLCILLAISPFFSDWVVVVFIDLVIVVVAGLL